MDLTIDKKVSSFELTREIKERKRISMTIFAYSKLDNTDHTSVYSFRYFHLMGGDCYRRKRNILCR